MKSHSALLLCASLLAVTACDPRAGKGGGEKAPTGAGPGVMALTVAECKQLGGTVETDNVCGGQNKKCTTVTTNPVTNAPESHSLCINEAG